MKTFITSTGKKIKKQQLIKALNIIADNLIQSAKNVRKQNLYADHVSDIEKDEILKNSIANAERIRNPENIGYELWLFQRLNTLLTGQCIPILP